MGQRSSQCFEVNSSENVRLIKGSHIVVSKMWSHEKSYFFQETMVALFCNSL